MPIHRHFRRGFTSFQADCYHDRVAAVVRSAAPVASGARCRLGRMYQHDPEIEPIKSVGERLRAAFMRSLRSRPIGFYMLLAMVLVLLMGGQIVYVKDDPKRFAFFLSLYFIFFIVLIFRAILDCFDIVREHFRKSEGLLRETFTEDEFAARLGRSVAEKEKKPS